MLTIDEKKVLLRQIDGLNIEIQQLRHQLNQSTSEKESFFDEKEKIGREIRQLISQARGGREQRNVLTEEVKSFKEERAKLNEQIKEKIERHKKLMHEKEALSKKLGLKEDPAALKREIERMHYKIETEGLSFDKETKLMKVIKELQKKFNESKKVSGVWDEAHKLSKEIDALREKADAFHAQIQQKAGVSQEKHVRVVDVSKRIDELTAKEDELNKKIDATKKVLEPVNQQLEEKLKLIAELSEKAQIERKETKAKHDSDRKKLLSEKQAEVQAKFKSGKKLTNEDLLIMQTIDDEE